MKDHLRSQVDFMFIETEDFELGTSQGLVDVHMLSQPLKP